jgi:hypothetical protein
MSEARVESIDSIKHLKISLVKFAEGATAAMGDSESEIVRMVNWLENEQTTYWQGEIRKRTEKVSQCAEAMRMKKLFKDSSGRQQSAIEEEKALRIAKMRLEESQQKLVAVRKALKRLEKEIPAYKAGVQRFSTTVQIDVPTGIAQLENLVQSLEAYVGLDTPVEVTSQAATTEPQGSMTRAVDEENSSPRQEEGSDESPSVAATPPSPSVQEATQASQAQHKPQE